MFCRTGRTFAALLFAVLLLTGPVAWADDILLSNGVRAYNGFLEDRPPDLIIYSSDYMGPPPVPEGACVIVTNLDQSQRPEIRLIDYPSGSTTVVCPTMHPLRTCIIDLGDGDHVVTASGDGPIAFLVVEKLEPDAHCGTTLD